MCNTHTRDMAHSYVKQTYKRHGSFICETHIQETWLIHMCNTHTRDMAHTYVQHTYKRHGSYICETHIQETWLILLTFVIVCCHRESNPQSSSHPAAVYTTALPVCCMMTTLRNFFIYYIISLYYRNMDISHNQRQLFRVIDRSYMTDGVSDSFRKLFLFFENTCQYLGGISHDISGSHFDSRRSLSSANQRQIVGDLPGRFLLSALLSLVISMTGRSERSARALRDGADVVREAI